MASKVFYIEKTSDTSADTLLAIGFARLLQDVLQQAGKSSGGLLIRNADPHYQIQLPTLIVDADIQQLKATPVLVRTFASDKQREKQLKSGWDVNTFGFFYDTQQQRSRMYYEARKVLLADEKRPEAIWKKERSLQLREVEDLRPAAEYAHYQTVSQMKVADTFNEIMRRWYTLNIEQVRYLLEILLTLFHNPLNDIAAAITRWQQFAKDQHIRTGATITALQLINPTTGKGANRTKSGEIAASGNIDSFWPLEMLKFAGFIYAAAPFVVKESKDRKTYVMQPNVIELKHLKEIMDDFRKVCWSSTAVKLDIMASLRFAQTFVEHRRRFLAAEEEEEDAFEEKQLNNLVQGFEMTFYKDLGSAYATMNVASIHMPSWLPDVENLSDAENVADLVMEHIQIIQGIQDSNGKENSEEYELLRFYRDFLSGNDLRPLWNFTSAYGAYLMSQRYHEKNPKQHIRQLSYKGLETIIMSNQMNNQEEKEILTSGDSFQNIADAIRRATVFAQYRRTQFDDRTYEVHYGLGQELRRKARHPKDFLIALADFLAEYNTETAREDEKAAKEIAKEIGHARPLTVKDRIDRNLRYMTDQKDLQKMEELVNSYGSELVGSLLVAVGTSFKGADKDTKNAKTLSTAGTQQ